MLKKLLVSFGSLLWNNVQLLIVAAPEALSLSGLMAQGHLMTVVIQGVDLILFSSPEDEQALSAVLLRILCYKYHRDYEVDQQCL